MAYKEVRGLMSGTYISEHTVYGIDMQRKRHPLLIAVADDPSGEGEYTEYYVIGVASAVDEGIQLASDKDLTWAATPSKGGYHQSEERED